MSEEEQAYLYYRSPQDIRSESFTHRMRGFDENEVREYLDLLADQMAAVEWERKEMRAELERLRIVVEQSSNVPPVSEGAAPESAPEGVDSAAAVLRHAQEVAEQLLEDASRRAHEIIATAQRQGHEVVRQCRIRTLDRMQSLYDELDGEFHRMGEAIRSPAPDGPTPAPPHDHS